MGIRNAITTYAATITAKSEGIEEHNQYLAKIHEDNAKFSKEIKDLIQSLHALTSEERQQVWDEHLNHLESAHVNCEYKPYRGRGLAAGHCDDCPFQDDGDDELKPLPAMSMDIDKDEYNLDEAGCSTTHPRHSALHWTGCYVEDCHIHTNKRYDVKAPSYANICRQCRTYGHKSDTC